MKNKIYELDDEENKAEFIRSNVSVNFISCGAVYVYLEFIHICIAGSSFGWSHHLAFGFLRRSTGQTTRFKTSSPTSWLDCSTFTSTRCSLHRRPVGWAARYLILRQPTGRIVRRFIVSYSGGSPAKLETPRCWNCSSLHHQPRWGLAS